MKAAVYKGNRRFEIEDLPTPEPGAGQVLMKVRYCAICGTDVHAFMYDIAPPGTVLGHEFCGTVAAVGAGVTRWQGGDRVIGGGGTPPPGKEPPTRSEPRFNYRTMGFPHGSVHAYAEYILMEDWQLLAIPEGVPDEAAALTEPCAVAVHAVRNSSLEVGGSAGIIGAGPIGLLCLQAARAAGATSIFVSEPAPARYRAAVELGADAVINPNQDDPIDRMVELTGGLGPDVVFDCAGIGSTLDQALNTVRRGGQAVLVAVPWEPLPLMPADWMAREIRFQSSWSSLPEDWRTALELVQSGKISMQPLLSEASFIPLAEIQSAFEALMKPSTQLQLVVKP